MFGDKAVDGRLEVGDADEDAALQALAGQLGEEALDGVEPGRGGAREVEVCCKTVSTSSMGRKCPRHHSAK